MGQPSRAPSSPLASNVDLRQIKKTACSFTSTFNEQLDKNGKDRMKVNQNDRSDFDKMVQDGLQVILRGFTGTKNKQNITQIN